MNKAKLRILLFIFGFTFDSYSVLCQKSLPVEVALTKRTPFLLISPNSAIIITEEEDTSDSRLKHTILIDATNNWARDTSRIPLSYYYSFTITSDGKRAFTESSEGISIWDMGSQKLLRAIDWNVDGMGPIAVSTKSNAIAAATYGKVKAWDIETGKELLSANIRNATEHSLTSFSPDDKLLLILREDSTLSFLNTTDGKEYSNIKIIPHNNCNECHVFSRDSKYITSIESGNQLVLWDIANGMEVKRFASNSKIIISSVAFSLDGQYVATGSEDSRIDLFELKSGKLIKSIKLSGYSVVELAFSSDSRTMIASTARDFLSDESQIEFVDVRSGANLLNLRKYTIGPTYDRLITSSKRPSGWCATYIYDFQRRGYGNLDGEPDGIQAFADYFFFYKADNDSFYTTNRKSFLKSDFQEQLLYRGLVQAVLNRQGSLFKP